MSALARLDEAGIPTLLINDSPQLGFDVPQCVRRAVHQRWMGKSCDGELTTAVDRDVLSAERRAAAALDRVAVLDLTNAICPIDPCPAAVDETIKYRDYHHLSVPFVLTLTEPIRQAITGLVDGGRAGQRAEARERGVARRARDKTGARNAAAGSVT